MDIFTLKQTILDMAEVAALTVLKLQNPAFDEVTTKEAYRLVGNRRWLDFHIKAGNLTPIRRGRAKNSPIYWSRLEIAALKKAEAESTRIKP